MLACYDPSNRPNLPGGRPAQPTQPRRPTWRSLVASGGKTVVYVNSREQSVAVARALRKRRAAAGAARSASTTPGFTRAERKRIEELFRTDALSVLVATIGLRRRRGHPEHPSRGAVPPAVQRDRVQPDERPRRPRRASRRVIHLLFGRADAGINERILRDMTPDHDCLAQVYRALRAMQRDRATRRSSRWATPIWPRSPVRDAFPVSPASAACGVAVFRELGLIETHTAYVSAKAACGPSTCVRERRRWSSPTACATARGSGSARYSSAFQRLGDEERRRQPAQTRSHRPHPAKRRLSAVA